MSENIENTQVQETKVEETKQPNIKQMVDDEVSKAIANIKVNLDTTSMRISYIDQKLLIVERYISNFSKIYEENYNIEINEQI